MKVGWVILVVGLLVTGCACAPRPAVLQGPVEDLLCGVVTGGPSHYEAPDHYDWYGRSGAYDRAPLPVRRVR